LQAFNTEAQRRREVSQQNNTLPSGITTDVIPKETHLTIRDVTETRYVLTRNICDHNRIGPFDTRHIESVKMYYKSDDYVVYQNMSRRRLPPLYENALFKGFQRD
jgi:hypothetical protein